MKHTKLLSYNHDMDSPMTAVIDIGGTKIAYGLLSNPENDVLQTLQH